MFFSNNAQYILMQRFIRPWLIGLAYIAFIPFTTASAEHVLEEISHAALPGEQLQLNLKFKKAPPEPQIFTTDNPARITLDFPNTTHTLAQQTRPIDVGFARSVSVAEANGRTRIVLNLARLASHTSRVQGNDFVLTLAPASSGASPNAGRTRDPNAGPLSETKATKNAITDVDFRRGETGEGRILVNLKNPSTPVDVQTQGARLIVNFTDTQLPSELQRRLDVTDFATPVKAINLSRRGADTLMAIEASGDYEHLAYQADDRFVVEVRPVTKAEQAARPKQQFTGERLSLNFQDIEIRSVLQLIADFTSLNIVVSDAVAGSITLRLKNVPWDQAMDIILRTKGLAMRRTDDVLLVAPVEEIAAREKLELEAQQQVGELAPLRSESIQINYASAADIAKLLEGQDKNKLLSERGNVAVDQRTNILLVQDTVDKLDEIRNLVKRLDIPVRQVLIESRVVIATDNFSKELGVRFGVSNRDPSYPNDDGNGLDFASGTLNGTTQLINNETLELNDRLNVNLPAADPAGSVGLALASLPLGLLLELELSAAQAESRAEIISTPRVITANQAEARIEQGVEIPYQQATSSGATSVSFKKAVLSLEVTPQITPDNRVFMQLSVNSDSVGQIFAGIPSINTREVTTQVLVDNGQTVVLGGIYEQNNNVSSTRVPFFSDLPLLGQLFRNKLTSNNKAELLIFVTPKIIEDNLKFLE